MPFYETNPLFWEWIFGITINPYGSCAGNIPKKSVGSFWKTNPIWGAFGRFDCRKNDITAYLLAAGLENGENGRVDFNELPAMKEQSGRL
jgi:hypothetical protein